MLGEVQRYEEGHRQQLAVVGQQYSLLATVPQHLPCSLWYAAEQSPPGEQHFWHGLSGSVAPLFWADAVETTSSASRDWRRAFAIRLGKISSFTTHQHANGEDKFTRYGSPLNLMMVTFLSCMIRV